MSVHDDEIRAVVRDSASHATELLRHVVVLADSPMLAMTSLMLANAVFARSLDMSREAFLEGTAAAFDSVSEGAPHATH